MRDYASLRKKNRHSATPILILAICVLLSGVLLFGRLVTYSQTKTIHSIPLTRSNGVTHVTAAPLSATPSVQPMGLAMQTAHGDKALRKMDTADILLTRNAPASPAKNRANSASSSAGALELLPVAGTTPSTGNDNALLWTGETTVEIFRISYDNESGETTVMSQDGLKILAPGTGNSYEFALENTTDYSLDYTLTMKAWFSDTEHPIPIYASVTDHDGNDILGNGGEKVPVLQLNEVNEAGVLASGNIQPYTLSWEWPFELDDEYDTLLGNLAAENSISLTVEILTTAQYNDDPNSPGGYPPQTGDNAEIALYAILLVASMAGILIILLLRKKEGTDEAN